MAKANSSNRSSLVVITLLVLLLGSVIVYYSMNTNNWNWSTHYRMDSDDPYGTMIIHDLLKTSNKGFVDIVDSLPDDFPADTLGGISSYLFIGEHLYIDSAETAKIIQFIAAGNKAFIFSSSISNRLVDSLLRRLPEPEVMNEYINNDEYSGDASDEDTSEVVMEEESEMYDYSAGAEDLVYYYNDSIVDVVLKDASFEVAAYPLGHRREDIIVPGSWMYFADSIESCMGEKAEVLGVFDEDYPNLIHLRYGAGDLYLQSTPLIFTNYSMTSDTAMKYNRTVLNEMGDWKLYWDESNRKYDPDWYDHDTSIPDEGPLEFILSEPSMRKGWYLLLSGAILYLAFGAKRKQRIIPAAENKDNTSIEYAEVISQLFMKQSDHKQLILLKMDLFKMYLRERFNIRLPQKQEDENAALFSHIAQRSGIKEALIQSIFEQYKYLSVIEGVDTPVMLDFHNKIEEFYFHSR